MPQPPIFAGYAMDGKSYKSSERIFKAIKNFPRLKNISDIRGWFGLENQIAYLIKVMEMMAIFMPLLKKDEKFIWIEDMNRVFIEGKEKIIACIKEGIIHTYDMNRTSILSIDWCKIGIGYILQQQKTATVNT